jgi:hypothetical protein
MFTQLRYRIRRSKKVTLLLGIVTSATVVIPITVPTQTTQNAGEAASQVIWINRFNSPATAGPNPFTNIGIFPNNWGDLW